MNKPLIEGKIYYKIFDRQYKYSTGIYNKYKYNDALKLAEVQNNCDSVRCYMKGNKLIILNQVHGNNVLTIESSTLNMLTSQKLIADGVVTNCKKLVLAIQTADCVPILFSCKEGEVIGAVHCGWRSARADIIRNIAHAMKKLGAKDIQAVIGPSIQQSSYEVDKDYYKNFVTESTNYSKFFLSTKKGAFFLFDLPAFVKYKLEQENIKIFTHIVEDTYSQAEKYSSYRRSFHRDEKYKSSILSCIMRV